MRSVRRIVWFGSVTNWVVILETLLGFQLALGPQEV
jgi:hypothetical protein